MRISKLVVPTCIFKLSRACGCGNASLLLGSILVSFAAANPAAAAWCSGNNATAVSITHTVQSSSIDPPFAAAVGPLQGYNVTGVNYHFGDTFSFTNVANKHLKRMRVQMNLKGNGELQSNDAVVLFAAFSGTTATDRESWSLQPIAPGGWNNAGSAATLYFSAHWATNSVFASTTPGASSGTAPAGSSPAQTFLTDMENNQHIDLYVEDDTQVTSATVDLCYW